MRRRNRAEATRPAAGTGGAFTLIELLVVIALLGLLAALVAPALARARTAARGARCLQQLQQLGVAVGLFADDNEDTFPRSQHSAFAHGQLTWGRTVARYLGSDAMAWKELMRSAYHCIADERPSSWSYGLNVYFELGPEDDYEGKPATWRRRRDVPRAGTTILLAENAGEADHIMPNFWAGPGDAADVAATRHGGQSNYAYVDGHAETRELRSIFDPAKQIDFWNPMKAP